MGTMLSPEGLAARLRREWRLRQLGRHGYGHLLDPAPPDEWVSLACEVTGRDPRTDQVLAFSAIQVSGQRVLTSQRLQLLIRPERPLAELTGVREHRLRVQDLEAGLPAPEAMRALLDFVGSRPLLGYYLAFDLAMLEPLVRPLLGMGLPQEAIDVSALYYGYQFRRLLPYQQRDGASIDLRLASMLQALDLPDCEGPSATERAVLVALAFLKLRNLSAV
jgi:DNA polymerase III subunit epsilon